MGYIYKITNDINDKVYIGKTEFDIQKRFKEHCKDSQYNYENRPLYKAMKKYGIEHFTIDLVEECNNIEEREKYWIEYYNSFLNGYNATLGGDGKTLIDYDLVLDYFNEGKTVKEISTQIQRDAGHIADILKQKGISQEEILKRSKQSQTKMVIMFSKTNEILKEFESVAVAAQYCIDNQLSKDKISGISSHISQCCNGIRYSAYRHLWKYK